MKKTIVLNLFGEPSVGKSTAAYYITSILKMKGINAEMVTEFAKDKVYEENSKVFEHQEYIFGKQSFKLGKTSDSVDIVVTDSPLLLSIIYNNNHFLTENFENTVVDIFNSYDNLNILLTRTHEYKDEGRFQTEEEAGIVRESIVNMLDRLSIQYTMVTSDIPSYEKIIDDIIKIIKNNSLLLCHLIA